MEQNDKKVPFKDPHETIRGFVEIIAPIFGINTFVKLAINQKIKNESDEELRKALVILTNYLNENVYKK